MTDVEFIDAAPTSEYLRSIVNDRLSIREAFGEFIDNSIDSGAMRVVIEIGENKGGAPSHLRIEDDGNGCENLVDMVQLGKHTNHKSTRLGRFGIGLKNAALWFGGVDSRITITSTCGGVTRSLGMKWSEYAKNWRISTSWLSSSAAEPGARGTVILVKPCIQRVPEGKALTERVRELGYLYSPAIKRGVQIIIRAKRKGVEPYILERWELPALSEIVDTHVSVDGRGARVYVGIVAPGAFNQKPGITYVHGFRVIKTNCGLGCKGRDYGSVTGFVELDDKWELTKNKDDLSRNREELEEVVFGAISGLLSKAERRGQELQFAALDLEVDNALNGLLGVPDRKAQRDAASKEGSVKPGSGKKKHRRAAREQDGSTFGNRSKPLVVRYSEMGDEKKLGDADSLGGVIMLNTSHPFIRSIRESHNAQALALAALTLFVDGARNFETNGQRRLRHFIPSDSVVKDVGEILSKHGSVDGKPLLSVVEATAAE